MAASRDDDYADAKRRLASAEAAERAAGLAELRRLAESGHARAQFRLGLLLAHGGADSPADAAEAARWCAAAAHQGLGKAQFNLGLLRAGGHGVGTDAADAARWLRLAAANGVDEAERCLDLVYIDQERPQAWEDAQTRSSVALARSDAEGGKAVRFAEYYVDPCINVLVRHLQLSREQGEDIVQQFMLELEQPLSKGEHRGRTWKESLRERFASGRTQGHQRFRPYLYRVLVNFARDWLRDQRRAGDGDRRLRTETDVDPAQVAEHHAEEWRAMLARFAAAAGAQAGAERATRALLLGLGDDLDQVTIAARLGISDRTVRKDLRLAAELLGAWLGALLAEYRLDGDAACRAGLEQLPGWLHHPVGVNRIRALLFLALVARRLPAQGR